MEMNTMQVLCNESRLLTTILTAITLEWGAPTFKDNIRDPHNWLIMLCTCIGHRGNC